MESTVPGITAPETGAQGHNAAESLINHCITDALADALAWRHEAQSRALCLVLFLWSKEMIVFDLRSRKREREMGEGRKKRWWPQ